MNEKDDIIVKQEIWKYDKNRLENIKKPRYTVLVIWKHDYKLDKNKINNMIIEENKNRSNK